jgi:hypothetical protein
MGYGMQSGSSKRRDDQPFHISLQVTWNLAVPLALRNEINSSARKRFDCGIAKPRELVAFYKDLHTCFQRPRHLPQCSALAWLDPFLEYLCIAQCGLTELHRLRLHDSVTGP